MTPNAVGSVSHVAHYNHSSLYLSQIERSRTLRGGQCEAKLITGKRALLRVVCSLSGHPLSWSSSIAILNHNCEWHYNIKLRRTLVCQRKDMHMPLVSPCEFQIQLQLALAGLTFFKP